MFYVNFGKFSGCSVVWDVWKRELSCVAIKGAKGKVKKLPEVYNLINLSL